MTLFTRYVLFVTLCSMSSPNPGEGEPPGERSKRTERRAVDSARSETDGAGAAALLNEALAASRARDLGEYDLPLDVNDRSGPASRSTDPAISHDFFERVKGLLKPVYDRHLDPRIGVLMCGSPTRWCAARTWLSEPVLSVCHSDMVFGLASVSVMHESKCPDFALDVAAWATITRAAGLILDDVVDRSETRANKPSAYQQFGSGRCLASVAFVCLLFAWAMLTSPGTTRDKTRRVTLSVAMLARGGSTQSPWIRSSGLESRLDKARRYYATVWWALLVPLDGSSKVDDRAIKQLLDRFSVGAKLLNDLRDYYGRGGKPTFEDLHARKETFPIFFLERAATLSNRDRERVAAHYVTKDETLSPSEIIDIFERYTIRAEVTSLALNELRLSRDLLNDCTGLPALARQYLNVLILCRWASAVRDGDLCRPRPIETSATLPAVGVL